ncbi:MAG: hypothetical protein [Wendovervirus sonii]|uniref:VWFA domain-containing protein n=1 Tax=phage Lak_Megaphage_Sonny TaxID=3109229 RepID=A0ABZ0Z5V8_9CAUD|nr:MAG: hypothetical protein [phage Lak_Megaphage_Sonny]
MGCGSFSQDSYIRYCKSTGRSYNTATDRASGQFYKETSLNEAMNPKNVIRECVNNEEHPNTVPVILGLDVTGSMGSACKETAEALAKIVKTLYNKFKDVEIMIMGIGDFVYDKAPLQVGQFESDVRIAADLDKIYMEHGGGGNNYESYSAAWYFGLYHTKLDCYDLQKHKGIIITMGDEPLNPNLSNHDINKFIGDTLQANVETPNLYEEASKKFDIFHIAVDDPHDCYERNADDIEKTFRPLLGQNLVISNISKLSDTICDCISKSIEARTSFNALNENVLTTNEKGEITW